MKTFLTATAALGLSATAAFAQCAGGAMKNHDTTAETMTPMPEVVAAGPCAEIEPASGFACVEGPDGEAMIVPGTALVDIEALTPAG